MSETQKFDIMIIGGGAAGLASAIYSGRSGLKTVVVEGKGTGGQTSTASEIENYPGFLRINGMELAMKFREHAEQYATILEGKSIVQIIPIENQERYHHKVIDAEGNEYLAGAIILTTGANHRKLGIKGEQEYSGKGVSYCATCDGFFFRNKTAFMIGGGNSALMEAVYLKEIGVDVHVVHRRNAFRAEKIYQDKAREMGIPLHLDSVLEEVKGEMLVKSILLKNVKTGEITEHETNGVFVAIGIIPNTQLAVDLGCEIDDGGFVKVDRHQRTKVPYIYAAGDLTGGLQQVVVAAGEGAVASMTAFEDLTNPYWV